jgi:HSF-type DNA-binding
MVPLTDNLPLQVTVFPNQLHYVLAELERNDQSHIASWQPHGRSFMVRDREAFVKTILPTYVEPSLDRQHQLFHPVPHLTSLGSLCIAAFKAGSDRANLLPFSVN